VPPREPAFFNPRAKLNRDFSILAYSAFIKNFKGPRVFLDAMCGIGSRALRVCNEIKEIDKVIANDANPHALEFCKKSSSLNKITNLEVSENEVCRFLSSFSKKSLRAAIVDIDPFGSPTKFVDCGLRATIHGGLLSTTATDLQVLHGLFKKACKRRYYGTPIKTEYGNEIALRLIIGCIAAIAGRLDLKIIPLFVENNQHYYRTYVKVLNKPEQDCNIGYISHCSSCGNREISEKQNQTCNLCNSVLDVAGPLWIGKMLDKQFVSYMLNEIPLYHVDKKCQTSLNKCLLESEMQGTYFTLDEIAAKMKMAPPSLKTAIKKLQENDYAASPTSLNPTGFRTNCPINRVLEILAS
jgi:tRNA (guanine26-N2/guanine27-N2)-dimethyltransferase